MSEAGAGHTPGNVGLTYADYAALPDDGHCYQLVEGELVMTPSPTRWHQKVSLAMGADIRAFVEREGLGEAYLAPLDVVLSDSTVVQPDVMFVSRARSAILTDPNINGAPDLCVEVLSPGTARLDRLRKLDLYARHGVPHYWIVDLDTRTIEEYVLQGEIYRVRSVSAAEDEFRPAALPGFSFRLATAGLP